MKRVGKASHGGWIMWRKKDGTIDLFRRKGTEIERKVTPFTTKEQVNAFLKPPDSLQPIVNTAQIKIQYENN